jgi:hypothetical protein
VLDELPVLVIDMPIDLVSLTDGIRNIMLSQSLMIMRGCMMFPINHFYMRQGYENEMHHFFLILIGKRLILFSVFIHWIFEVKTVLDGYEYGALQLHNGMSCRPAAGATQDFGRPQIMIMRV